ncbi:MAG: four helix bundle protein [Verrucomicrobia bacterium]|nr:four helix bundle protein [Verrucomicrobiota bacterium]
MATVEQFEDLHVWQGARGLVNEVYKVTKQGPFRRDFSLRDQITRAAISSMSNIAEGFERGSRKEFIQFLNVAKGSTGEVRSQLYIALDQEYVDQKKFEKLRDAALAVSRRLAKFIGYLEGYSRNSRVRRSRKSQVQEDL